MPAIEAEGGSARGESEQRLYALSALFTDRERAAPTWTEAVTLVSQIHAPDNVFAVVRAHFPDLELVNLTMAVIAINGWDRLAISFREVVGNHQSLVHISK